VRDVGLEEEGVALAEKVLLAAERRLELALLYDEVFFHAFAVSGEVARGRAFGDDVSEELDAPPGEGRRERLPLEARLGVPQDHAPLPGHEHDLTPLLHAGQPREAHTQALGEAGSYDERRVLLAPLELGDHGPAPPDRPPN